MAEINTWTDEPMNLKKEKVCLAGIYKGNGRSGCTGM